MKTALPESSRSSAGEKQQSLASQAKVALAFNSLSVVVIRDLGIRKGQEHNHVCLHRFH